MKGHTLTKAGLRRSLKSLKLSQRRAAKLVGYTPRSVARWAAGQQAVPRSVALLLTLMIAHDVKPEDLKEQP
jgi:transcriptional regulator with XRE-family HTH domain